jgi:hypothetical protein
MQPSGYCCSESARADEASIVNLMGGLAAMKAVCGDASLNEKVSAGQIAIFLNSCNCSTFNPSFEVEHASRSAALYLRTFMNSIFPPAKAYL